MDELRKIALKRIKELETENDEYRKALAFIATYTMEDQKSATGIVDAFKDIAKKALKVGLQQEERK